MNSSKTKGCVLDYKDENKDNIIKGHEEDKRTGYLHMDVYVCLYTHVNKWILHQTPFVTSSGIFWPVKQSNLANYITY